MSWQVIKQDTLGYKEWAEYKVHENVCGKIKDGAGWSNPDHKTAYTGGIPFPWFGNKLFIYIVPWDCCTGQVVDQVQENQMYTFHWQEWQKAEAASTENIFPKLEEAVILMYLIILA